MGSLARAFDPPPDRVDDRALIARVLAGDRTAGRALYEAHAPRVFRVAFRMTRDEVLAQDFTQETFIRAFAQLGTFRGDAALSTWLHRIAFTVTANGMRKVKRLRMRETPLEAAEGVGQDADDAELRTRLHAAIEALPEIYQSVIVLHLIEGFTHAEIAEIQGVAEGTCKSRLHTARAMLRATLADLAPDEA